MAKKPLPSPEVLRQLLRYEPETGKLFWRERGLEWFKDISRPASWNCAAWNARWANTNALNIDSGKGYLQGGLFGRMHKTHRIVWAMSTGAWPDGEIDHINGNKTDNRLENLRAVPRATNLKNMPKRIDNTSGCTGVYLRKTSGKWAAEINGKSSRVYLGTFSTKDDAIKARKTALSKHGYHENHGRPT